MSSFTRDRAGTATGGKARREVISNNPDDFGADDEPDNSPYVHKDEKTKNLLVTALSGHYIFSSLGTNDLMQVINKMAQEDAPSGKEIITQGDGGSEFFVLGAGTAQIVVSGQVVGEYTPGSSFGELALLYNAKRAATIKATSACTLWKIGIKTFRSVAIKAQKSSSSTKTDFLRNVPLLNGIDNALLDKIGGAMKSKEYKDGEYIIREGDAGDEFYLIETGGVSCTHNKPEGGEQQLLTLGRGDYFGEMALMLDEPRHANCIAIGATKCYAIGRDDFTALFGTLQDVLAQQMRIRILKSVPLLSHLTDKILDSLANAMRVQFFEPGTYILKQGDTANNRFYIINDGDAKITKNVVDAKGKITGENEVGSLTSQDYFGERALIHNEPRGANVIAVGQVECLVLPRSMFEKMLTEVEAEISETMNSRESSKGPQEAPKATELQRMCTLGTGTFGRVSLIYHGATKRVMALKAMQKQQIMQSKQERNIMNEKRMLEKCKHPLVLELIACYQDRDSIYMLMEIIQGGELWCYIYERMDVTRTFRSSLGGFKTDAAQFYAGCVISAFKYIHGSGVAYRDLKPENLLIDLQGYCKVIDFGFAKEIPNPKGDKSYTICGTPEYLAPEILNSKGHGRPVDLWALGCLVYELIVGRTPFADDNQSKIFQRILGADKFLASASVWPRGFEPEAKDLVKQLLHANALYRIGNKRGGYEEIETHPWFAQRSFDWKGLLKFQVKAPYVPTIKDPLDTSNFDPFDEDDRVPRYTGSQNVYTEWSDGFVTFPPPQR